MVPGWLRLAVRPSCAGGWGARGWYHGSFGMKKGLTGYLGAVLGPEGVEYAVAVRAAVGVRAEEVA